MQKKTAGVQRALQRLRPPNRSTTASIRSGAHRISRGERVADQLLAVISPRLERLVARLGGREHVLPIGIAILVLIASVSGAGFTGTVKGATGSTASGTAGPRLTIGGLDTSAQQIDGPDQAGQVNGTGATTSDGPSDLGQYLSDGTLLKPLAVDTTVSDASAKLITYTVKSGDTLSGIAAKFHTTAKIIEQLNKLKSPFVIHPGEVLKLP